MEELYRASSPELYLDKNHRVPSLSAIEDDFSGWLGLNFDVSLVPANAEAARSDTADFNEHDSVHSTGQPRKIDWSTQPTWYSPEDPWRGFIPVKDPSLVRSSMWFLNVSEPVQYTKMGDSRITFTKADVEEFSKDAKAVQDLVDTICRLDQESTHLPRPVYFPFRIVNDLYWTPAALQEAARNLKRAVLDRLGWLRWVKLGIPHLLRSLSPEDRVRLDAKTSSFTHSRGYLVDLASDWNEINIPLWLTHDIPIFYKWTLEARMDERFCKLNPKLIAADLGSEDEERVLLQDVEKDEEFYLAVEATTRYDDYFQLKKPHLTDGMDLAYEADSETYLVDFEGWGRRRLLGFTDSLSYTRQFHYRTFSGDEGEPTILVVLRNAKKEDYFTRVAELSRDEGYSESEIRELYKSKYAPRRARVFDKETGMLVRPVTVQGSDEPSPQDLFQWLNVRRRPSQISVISQRRGVDRGRERENQPMERSITMNQSSERSRSPRRGQQGQAAPVDPLARRLTEARAALAQFKIDFMNKAASTTYHGSMLPVNGESWDLRLFDVGVLMLTDKRVEVRLRYLAKATPQVNHIRKVLQLALEHRMEFQIDRISTSAYYDAGFNESPFQFTTIAHFGSTYLAKMGDLLSRPHARAFIGLGGPYSWLAERFGESKLVDDFMSGPSMQTSLHTKGATDAKYPNRLRVSWDQVSATEIGFLFGHIPFPGDDSRDRWLFPTPPILADYCPHWSGEWNTRMESIFGWLAKQLTRSPSVLEPKTRGGWRGWLKTYSRYEAENPLELDDAEELLVGFQKVGLQATWDHTPLRQILLPEF
ncbi:hypothetical protein CPC08DRAFT_766603 [Agrocybe pediades]|nr:hypothetical protein CPC08DRAFT_766603 [Agrocybe pediades]